MTQIVITNERIQRLTRLLERIELRVERRIEKYRQSNSSLKDCIVDQENNFITPVEVALRGSVRLEVQRLKVQRMIIQGIDTAKHVKRRKQLQRNLMLVGNTCRVQNVDDHTPGELTCHARH